MEYGHADQPSSGRFVGHEHRLPIRVYFEDTDLSGVVYHANYLRFMERGRSDMLRVAGIDQRAVHDAGEGAYAITSLAIRYAAPARLDDMLVVATSVKAVRGASISIHQRVMRETLVLAEADVVAALVSPSGKARRQPRNWIDRFSALVDKGEITS